LIIEGFGGSPLVHKFPIGRVSPVTIGISAIRTKLANIAAIQRVKLKTQGVNTFSPGSTFPNPSFGMDAGAIIVVAVFSKFADMPPWWVQILAVKIVAGQF